ncbi:helix-turn-helix transcriptional regulator [Actinoplanes sp. NPDC051851]|uniref:helix-turn-helix domain-containing protein n=1 Tax=Actinoplanes sp. NPDC051851 TaxID=3154753 RepID=UPI00342A112D
MCGTCGCGHDHEILTLEERVLARNDDLADEIRTLCDRVADVLLEAAARRLDVSTKTVSRWVSGTTEPRLRDLYRIRDTFGDPPLH